MKKQYAVFGLGSFGESVAIELQKLGCEVVAIDANMERVEAIANQVSYAMKADIEDADFIRSLGVRNFDVCIVAIGDNFQSSLEATSLLKELGAKMVVSRAARDVHAKFLLRNGADEVVYPEKQLASWTAIRYSADHIFDYVELDEEHGIFEISIPDTWVGKTVGKLDIRKRYNVNIMALRCHGVLDMNISPDIVLEEYQTMLVLGNIKNIQKQFHI